MAKVTTTTTVYRSKKMSDHQKRLWVTKYLEFKKVYPHITMRDWCKMNYLSPGTFAAWYGDVRYNKQLAENMKRKKFEEPEQKETDDDEQLEFENLESPESNPEINAESHAESSNDEEEPDVKVKTETDFTGLRMDQDEGMDGKYVIFTCADFRLEISRAMPARDIDMIIGFATAQAFKYKKGFIRKV